MNWVAPHLTNKRVLQGAVRNGRLLKTETGWNKEVTSKGKDYFRQGYFLEDLIMQVTSLVRIWKIPGSLA